MNTPNTVAEFLSQQAQLDEQSWEDTMMDTILEKSPAEGYHLVIRTLQALLKLHADHIAEYVKEDDAENVLIWTKDATLLDSCINLLKAVDMGDE